MPDTKITKEDVFVVSRIRDDPHTGNTFEILGVFTDVEDANMIAHKWFSQDSGEKEFKHYAEDQYKDDNSLHIHAENAMGVKWNVDVDKRMLQRRVPANYKTEA